MENPRYRIVCVIIATAKNDIFRKSRDYANRMILERTFPKVGTEAANNYRNIALNSDVAINDETLQVAALERVYTDPKLRAHSLFSNR